MRFLAGPRRIHGRPLRQVDFATHFFDRDVLPLSPPAFLLSLRARDKLTSLPHECTSPLHGIPSRLLEGITYHT